MAVDVGRWEGVLLLTAATSWWSWLGCSDALPGGGHSERPVERALQRPDGHQPGQRAHQGQYVGLDR